MTKEQQYWEDTQEALSRIFDRCEEIDPQSGYDMLEDIQFVRGFINKHKSRADNATNTGDDSIKTVTNAEEAKKYPISEDISKGIKNGQIESEEE